jgi:tetratricopeptide (TPR) repeat protein
VAVKVLRSSSFAACARFERERRLLSELGEREGFVPLLESGDCDGYPFFVFPFLEHGTLRARLARGPLTFEDSLDLASRLARALGIAHARGIVHRDLKPENILFADPGRPLVADLGLAKHFDLDAPGRSASVSITKSGAVAGTPGYMAPEQLRDAKSAGPTADVYALGAILYECLTGSPPVPGAFVALGRLRPDAPRWLEAVLGQTLDPDPERRPKRGDVLLGMLEAGPRGRRLLSKVIAGASTVLVACVASFAYGTIGATRAPEKDLLPVRRAAPSTEDPRPVDLVLERARALERVMDWKGARVELDRAVAIDSRCAAAYAERAIARDFETELEAARSDADRAMGLGSKKAVAWVARSMVRGQEDMVGSVADANRAIELEPSYARAWSARARAREVTNDREGALADATRAIELDPKDPNLWGIRSRIRRRGGDSLGAIHDVDRVVELAPHSATSYLLRGGMFVSLKKPEQAIVDLSRAIELDSDLADAWERRAYAYALADALEDALRDADRAIELAPAHPNVWFTRGDIHAKAGHREAATRDLERYFELGGTKSGAREKLERLRAGQ